MIVDIANHDCTIKWDGVYYFALSDYPNISDWELRKLILFIEYEKKHDRETEIVCEDETIIQSVNHALANPALYLSAKKSDILTECTACKQGGCITDMLCHTASIEDAKSIFRCGKILSAVKARNKTGAELAAEPRNAAGDPPDYFDSLMFAWGNCQAGDRLVMERKLGRGPDEYDLSDGFQPGVRFYFEYTAIENHAGFVYDGYHPAKVKDELSLLDCLYCCVIPESEKAEFERIVPPALAERVLYVEHDCKDVWDWADKVYGVVCERKNQ